ncbi:MAG TPA: hypothetical protein VFF26_14765 [Gallionella sp.]|nr:hypothetical protein [Gallionella sp.]
MANEFEALCDLLPADVHWGDLLTPAIVAEIAMAVETREREACIEDVRTVGGEFAGECEALILKRSNE